MAQDLRVPMAPILGAFGLSITVTRPAPDEGPVVTTGVWVPPLTEAQPFGTDFQRREPRKVMAIERSVALPSLPRGTTILAAEEDGATVRTWRVDGLERTEADLFRVSLVPLSDLL